MKFGIIGSGSWATALAKILTDNNNAIHWWIRNTSTIKHLQQRHHNPHYLSSAYFNTALLTLKSDIADVVNASDVLVIAVPSAFVEEALQDLPRDSFKGKKVMSAIKGILPSCNQLLNDYMREKFLLLTDITFLPLNYHEAGLAALPPQKLKELQSLKRQMR